MRVDDTSEGFPAMLALGRFNEQIVILGEKDTAKGRRAIKKLRVRNLMILVFVRGNDIYLAQSQAKGYCARYMMIHVELERHTS